MFKDRIRGLRPAYRPADPASRTSYEPGEIGQCDLWFPLADIPPGTGKTRGGDDVVAAAGAAETSDGFPRPTPGNTNIN